MYAHVEDGSITQGPGALPKNWRNVSGLNLAADNELKARGWLPATITEPTYVPSTHKKGNRVETITDDAVTITWEVVALTAEEISERTINEAKAKIYELEQSVEDRWIRNAPLGDAYAVTRLQEIEDAIAVERAKL